MTSTIQNIISDIICVQYSKLNLSIRRQLHLQVYQLKRLPQQSFTTRHSTVYAAL